MNASYILPLRLAEPAPAELTAYLAWLSPRVDLIVVDASPPAVCAEHERRWADLGVRHARPDPEIDVLNGKVAGVLSGLRLARHDPAVIADDDVRYDAAALARVVRLLDDADLVRPQNYFRPCPWHARWDTARSLLNRLVGGDYPGTLAVRRSAIPHGYDGDVLFENLQLIRTVEAGGGRTVTPLDCYVRRLPPTSRHFWSQRVRQAYDDLAQPHRLVPSLLIMPLLAATVARRHFGVLAGVAAVASVAAEVGRRRAGGTAVFPASASLLAPAWLLERGACSWLAVGSRLFLGGIVYHGRTIRRAASRPTPGIRAVTPSAGVLPRTAPATPSCRSSRSGSWAAR